MNDSRDELSAQRMRRAFGLTAASAVFSTLVFAGYPQHTPDAVINPGPLIYAAFCLILLLFAIAAFIYAVRAVFVCRVSLPIRITPVLLSLVLPTSLVYQSSNPPHKRREDIEHTAWDRVQQFQRLGELVNPALIDLFAKEPERFSFSGVGEQAKVKGLKQYLLSRSEIPAALLRFSGDTLLDPWGSSIEILVDKNHDQFLQTDKLHGHPIRHEKGLSNGAGLRMRVHPGVIESSHQQWALKNSVRP